MKLEHIAMYVKDLEAAKEFFIKYFGAKPNEEYHNKKRIFARISFALTAVQGLK